MGDAASIVLGERWRIGTGRALHGDAMLHRATTGDGSVSALVEIHPVPDAVDATALTSAVRRSAMIANDALLAVLDVGVSAAATGTGTATDGAGAELYVVTDVWDNELPTDRIDEAGLRAVATAVADALVALHEAGLHHGGLYRGSLRMVGGSWKVSPAGMEPVLQRATAAYRPPGLHVMEMPSTAADVWNLGILLDELATGRLLRPGEEPRIADAPVIDHIVAGALKRDPDDRPTASEIRHLLETTPLGAQPALPRPGSPDAGDDTPQVDDTPNAPATRLVNRPDVDGAVAERPPPAARSAGSPVVWIAAVVVAIAVLAAVGIALAVLPGSGGDVAADAPAPAAESAEEAEPADEQAEESEPEDLPPEEPVRTGTVAVADLRIGDCIEFGLGQGVVDAVELRSCDELHTAEVIAIDEPPEAAGDGAYPGRQALVGFGRSLCDSAFTPYVGADVLLTVLGHQGLVPTFGEWESGDRRSIVCVATRFDGDQLEESVADAFARFRLVEGQTTSIGKLLPSSCFDVEAGDLVATGKRQEVALVGCLNLHGYEVFHFDALALEPGDSDALQPDPTRYQEMMEAAIESCDTRFAELTPLPGVEGGRTFPVIPDVYDWQIGDQLFLCVVAWPTPVLNSIVINDQFETENGSDGS